jgi:hypothetical protein
MSPNGTEKTKLSQKEWRDLILAELKGKGRNRYYSAICPICLISYESTSRQRRFCPRVGGGKGGFSYPKCALRRFELKDKLRPSTSLPEYGSGATRIGIVNEGDPPMRFGKSLDLPVSFCMPEFFPWPASL